MRTHTQSHTKMTGKEDSDGLNEVPRKQHDAMSVSCPACNANAGAVCKASDGTPFRPLTVHMARQEASL